MKIKRLRHYPTFSKKNICIDPYQRSILAAESWQSGRLRQSWKLLYWKVPGVRIPNSPLRVNTQMRKAVKVLDFHGFFVLVHATRNVKKRIISFQKRDPFLKNGKKGHAKADKSH